ncbi:hypothetical protein BdWA1_001767 [Babesia duncani]|uniref:Uncharacterized protein n=1 Tax=Babesia duncani TaxID=323732 RepID=A0AAD9PKH1_9APIC|nr:hypothetical protein BdWA1_001767 [Babesia duncani]
MSIPLLMPAALLAATFFSFGTYVYFSKGCVLGLAYTSIISACYTGATIVILRKPDKYIGFCLSCTISICVAGLGAFLKLRQRGETENRYKKNVANVIFHLGLFGASFYLGVLLGKRYATDSKIIYVTST